MKESDPLRSLSFINTAYCKHKPNTLSIFSLNSITELQHRTCNDMKLLYTTLLLSIFSITQAQVPGLFVLNYSDLAGNGITADSKGAIYNFNNGNFNNCNTSGTPYNHPDFRNVYTWDLDSNNGYLQVGINTTPLTNMNVGLGVHLFQGNCNWLPKLD